jgi:hypothetical protein
MSETTEEIRKPTQEELDTIRVTEQARILAPKTAFGDELRRLRAGASAFDLTEAADRVVENLKIVIAKNIVDMKQLAQAGLTEHHIQIFFAYPSQTLEIFKEAVEIMNKKKLYGLNYRIEVSPGVFVVWAAW